MEMYELLYFFHSYRNTKCTFIMKLTCRAGTRLLTDLNGVNDCLFNVTMFKINLLW